MARKNRAKYRKTALRFEPLEPRIVLSAQGAITGDAATADEMAVVINEIHYNSLENTEQIEFIELYNNGPAEVDLSNWAFDDGVQFVFPQGTTIDSGAYLLVGETGSELFDLFGVSIVGEFAGSLSGDGERVQLTADDGTIIDVVDYGNSFPWPVNANGGGSLDALGDPLQEVDSSMELIHPDLDNDLGGSWRSSITGPTPGVANSVFAPNAAPQIRQVDHSPQVPVAGEATTITAKVSDPDGVASVELEYQVVLPGQYVPAFVAKTTSVLRANPHSANAPNPDYTDPINWSTVVMLDDGLGNDVLAGDGVYTAIFPAQINRTLVRYRITVEDSSGNAVTVPYADDPSLNFAYFVYDGVPDYVASQDSVHADGEGHVWSSELLTSSPVYSLIADAADMAQMMAYNSGDQLPKQDPNRPDLDSRGAYNWRSTFVYDGVVYDNIKMRLRGTNGRYQQSGKRSMKFRFNNGSYLQAHDANGDKYPERWRTLDVGKQFDNRQVGNFGITEELNSELWRLTGVEAPYAHHFHFRVVDGVNETDQYDGDFWGMFLAFETYDVRYLETHNLEKGNLYKLRDATVGGEAQQRYQGPLAPGNSEDYDNIHGNLGNPRSSDWLNTYVDYDYWNSFHTVVEAIRHYDYWPTSDKNQTYYFKPTDDPNNLFGGVLQNLPFDSDASWGPTWNGGEDIPKHWIYGDGNNPDSKEAFQIEYRNAIREFRDLIWTEEVIQPWIDRVAARVAEFSQADRDRWRLAPGSNQDFGTIESKVQDMKNFAFVGGSWPGGGVGAGGRAAHLDSLANASGDAASIPDTATISYIGAGGFPNNAVELQTTAFVDSQGAGAFAAIEWRVAEITDPTAPIYDLDDKVHFEWETSWESGELTTFSNQTTVPGTAIEVGHTYRARVRMKDDTGRWGHWSAPLEFTATDSLPTPISQALRITEVNYNPYEVSASEALAGITDNDQFEFIEITNVSDTQVNLAGVQLIDGVGYAFGNIDLPAGQQIVVVRDLTAFQERYGADGIMIAGTWDPDISGGKLSNGGEDVVLIDAVGTIVHDFKYDNSGSWPGRADGKGSTLEVLDTSGDYNDPDNWRSSGEFNGSPGEEGQGLDRRVVINELLTHTDPPQTDTIELLNTTDAPIDVGGWYLSDNNNRYNKFRIPDGTIIAARGYLVFDENDFNVSLGVDPNDFALNGAHGDDVYLLSGDASDNVLDFIDHVEVGAALNGISYGRWPDETSRLVPMQWNSFGRENAYPVMPDLMISEIHYNPAHATPRAWTKQAGNWQLTGGHLESSGDPTGSVNYLATVDAEQTDVRVDVTVNFPEELNSAPAYGLFDMDASGIIGRYNSSFDFVVTGIRQFSGEVGVWKYAGIWTEVVTPVAIPGGVVVGDDYRLSATFDGTMITVSVNGFELISADTSVNTIGAQFGLRALSEGDQFDDFLVTPFDGSPLTTDSFSRDSTSGLGMTDELGNDLEFVEIYNASDATIDLTGWRLRKGIDYDFVEPGASAVSLDAGETIVVLSFNPADPLNADRTAQFRSGHEIDASVVLVGGYGGKLGNNGESIELQRPDMPPLLEPDFTPHIVTDRVVYEAVAPWPDVLISFESLNRTSIDTFGHESASWQASAPTPGSAVMNVAAPRVVGVGAGGPVYGTSQVIEASAAGITTLEIYFNAPQFLLGPTRVLDGAIQLDDNGQSGSGTYRQFDLDAAAMHRWLEVTTGGGLPVESLFVGQLLGDLDGDHAIGAGDLSRLFGSATSTDITGDGITNAADLAQILAMWGDALPEIPLGDPAISDIATEVIDAALVELSTEPAVMGPLPTLIVQPIGPQEVSSFSRLRTRRTLRPELPDEPTTRLARRRRLLRSAVDVVIEEDTFRRWR